MMYICNCNSSGKDEIGNICSQCNGKGMLTLEEMQASGRGLYLSPFLQYAGVPPVYKNTLCSISKGNKGSFILDRNENNLTIPHKCSCSMQTLLITGCNCGGI